MKKTQNLPTIGEMEKALTVPWFTANIETSPDASVVITAFDWRGEKFTKLILRSALGSQTMILDQDALEDIAVAFTRAIESIKP